MPRDVFLELVSARVLNADRPWEEGIVTVDGKTLPFLVERSWSGPAGNYVEQWSIRRSMGETIYQSDAKYVFVRGIQSITKHVDRVDEPIWMEPGAYRLVFVIEGFFMGSADIQVVPAGSAAA